MKQSKAYPNIDMKQTGVKLKQYMDDAGLSVKDIQEYLHLSCPQPIYRWMKGSILPSVNHLLMLSELFEVHMEELLVKKQRKMIPVKLKDRLKMYCKKLERKYILTQMSARQWDD